jgi:hypothetical protein
MGGGSGRRHHNAVLVMNLALMVLSETRHLVGLTG